MIIVIKLLLLIILYAVIYIYQSRTLFCNVSIIMPTQSWKNLDPETGVHWDVDEQYWNIIRAHWPAYDKAITPTNTMGAVAEMFRQWSGALRSDHPARSVAAWGKHAAYLTENHDLSDIFGEDFVDIGAAFEKENPVSKANLGNAEIRCMQQRSLVDFAVKWIEENRNVEEVFHS